LFYLSANRGSIYVIAKGYYDVKI